MLLGIGLGLWVALQATNFVYAQMRKAAGYKTPPRRRRQVPVSASFLPQ